MSGNSTTGTETMMIPWFHFTGGDHLLFKSVHPSSSGAIAGACIVLVVLALLERWVAATRAALEVTWRRRTLALISGRSGSLPSRSNSTDKSSQAEATVQNVSRSNTASSQAGKSSRMIAPFIASHDIPRGAIYAVQALLGYAIMLSVMTFQAAYLISIVAGLGLGELLFGRMGSGMHIH